MNNGDSGWQAAMINPEAASAPLKAAADALGVVAKSAFGLADVEGNLLMQERRVEDDISYRGGLLNLKKRASEIETVMDDGGDWKAALERVKTESLENMPVFHDEYSAQKFTMERDATLEHLTGGLIEKDRKLKKERSRALFDESFTFALDDAKKSGNWGEVERTIKSGVGKYYTKERAARMMVRAKEEVQDVNFAKRIGEDPRVALKDLRGEYGATLDEKTRYAYEGKAMTALSKWQGSNAEKLGKAAFLGDYVDDDALKKYVEDDKLGYDQALSYKRMRDAMKENSHAFDADAFDDLQSKVYKYDVDADVTRTGMADIRSRIATAVMPKDSKDYLFGVLESKAGKSPDMDAMSVISGTIDNDFKGGMLVQMPVDDDGEVLPVSAGGEALKAYNAGLVIKSKIKRAMEDYVRTNPGKGIDAYMQEYEKQRNKIVTSKEAGAFQSLLSKETTVIDGLPVPAVEVVPVDVTSSVLAARAKRQKDDSGLQNLKKEPVYSNPFVPSGGKAESALGVNKKREVAVFDQSPTKSSDKKGIVRSANFVQDTRDSATNSVLSGNKKNEVDFSASNLFSQSNISVDSFYGVKKQTLRGLTEKQALNLVLHRLGGKAKDADVVRKAQEWVRKTVASF